MNNRLMCWAKMIISQDRFAYDISSLPHLGNGSCKRISFLRKIFINAVSTMPDPSQLATMTQLHELDSGNPQFRRLPSRYQTIVANRLIVNLFIVTHANSIPQMV